MLLRFPKGGHLSWFPLGSLLNPPQTTFVHLITPPSYIPLHVALLHLSQQYLTQTIDTALSIFHQSRINITLLFH